VYGSITGKTYQGTSNGLNYPVATNTSGGIVNHWYWVCRNPETNVSVTCNAGANFQCTGKTPENAYICNYSDKDSIRKDDRELNQNVKKKLKGDDTQKSRRCTSLTDTIP
jgi:hypothetical protein